MSVEFHVGKDDAPHAIEHHTIYNDIQGMSSPAYLGVTVRVYNFDTVTLYMQLSGSGSSWTFTPTNMGSVGESSNGYFAIDRFGYRTLPESALNEMITLTLRAYTDASYSILKWTYTRSVYVVWIKSDDLSWTEDDLDSFGDGTLHGWTITGDYTPSLGLDTGTVLSAPYSALGNNGRPTSFVSWISLNKTIVTPDRTYVYMIANVRWAESLGWNVTFTYSIKIAGTTYIYLVGGQKNKWMRFVVPLPVNQSVTINIRVDGYSQSHPWWIYEWLDDVKFISKN